MARKSKGRQKIEMTKMSKESNLLVTFSKRRSGLFKKASELCTLCGAEIAIIVFSPGKKVFSFGHPCVESIVDRFLNQTSPPSSNTIQLIEAHRNANVRELNLQLSETVNQLEMEKKRGEELAKMRSASRGRFWWEAPIDDLGIRELEELRRAMEELKRNVQKQSEKIVMMDHHQAAVSSLMPFFGTREGHVGGSDVKGTSGFGLSMTPRGYALGYGHGFF